MTVEAADVIGQGRFHDVVHEHAGGGCFGASDKVKHGGGIFVAAVMIAVAKTMTAGSSLCVTATKATEAC